jgi:hypothetical protein
MLQLFMKCILRAVRNVEQRRTIGDFIDFTRFAIQDHRVPTLYDRCEFAKVLLRDFYCLLFIWFKS